MNKKTYNPWQDPKWLKEKYFVEKLTFKKIGKLVGRTDRTICHFFHKFGFKARPGVACGLTGSENPNWKGGRVFDSHGYRRIYHPESHAYKGKNQKYVLEHVLIMEDILGRPLRHPEIIHHRNGDQKDNRPENLQLFATPFEHNSFEQLHGLFAKKLLFGNLAPHLQSQLQVIFQDFLSSIVNER